MNKNANNGYTKWEDKTTSQRIDSVNTYYKILLAKAMGEKKTFWNKSMSKEEMDKTIPYNASTGRPYGGVHSLVLRAVSELNGYKDGQFLTMREANFLHGKLKYNVNEKGEKEYEKGVKVIRQINYEYQPKLNTKGEQILDKDNKPVLEKIPLEQPKIETATLYHTSQFNDLDTSKLKERNLEPLNKSRENIQNKPYDLKVKAVRELGLGKNVTEDLTNFLTAQMKGTDYVKVQHQNISMTKNQAKEQDRAKAQEPSLGL